MAFTKEQLDAYIQALYDDDGQLSSNDYQLIINYILSNGQPETDPRDLIQVRRGDAADLPTLAQGEPAYTLDTEEFYIGGLNGNVRLSNIKQFQSLGVNVLFPPKPLTPVIGDGVSDDTAALQAIAKYCINNDLALYIPYEATCYITANVDMFAIKNINIEGEIKGSNIDTVVVDMGGRAISEPLNVNTTFFNINKVTGAKLRLSGIKNGYTNINYCEHLLLWADGNVPDKNSMAYSRFNLGMIWKLEFDSTGISQYGVGGWINENVFIGGRIKEFIMKGNYPHNANSFYKPFLEACTMTFDVGANNTFHDVRFEGENTITFGAETYGNQIYKSYVGASGAFLRGSTLLPYADNGKENFVGLSAMAMYEISDKFVIDKNSQNYSLSDITPNANDLTAIAYRVIYETDLIEIKEDFGFELDSDASKFRIQVFPFDKNRQPITGDDPLCISSLGITWDGNRYITGADYNAIGAAIFKNTAVKFIKILVSMGSTGGTFKSMKLFYRNLKSKNKPLNVPVLNKHKRLNHNVKPTTGVWKTGDIVYNNAPVAGGYTGWICVDGNLNTWKGFGLIEA